MSIIKVCEILKTRSLLSPDKGKELYDHISEQLEQHAAVTLDFQHCDYISSSFLNESIGRQLIDRRWTAEMLRERIRWHHVPDDDDTDILIAVENAETKLHLINNRIDPDEFYQRHVPEE